MGHFGTTQSPSVRDIFRSASHITKSAGKFEPCGKIFPVPTPDSYPALTARGTSADGIGPSRGVVIGLLLGAGLWVVILGTVYLLKG